MDKNFIIFGVLASLVQSSVTLPLTISYGLTEEQLVPLTQIIVNQDPTVSATFDAFNPIFDVIEKYAAVLIWNLKAVAGNDSSKIAKALARAKDAVDSSLDAVPIALKKSYSAIEVGRNKTYANLNNAYAAATAALILAQSGNYSANRAQLEKYQAAVRKEFASLISSIYDAIRSCLDTTDATTSAVIQHAHDGSGNNLIHVTNAVFNAIKLYAAAVTARTANVSLIFDIEDFRNYALTGLRADVEYEFSTLKAIYIATQLDQIEILSELATNQYALTVSFHRYQAAAVAVFGAIEAGLTRVSLGLYDVGKSDFSLTDAAQAITAATINAGIEAFLASVLSAHPDATSVVASAEETFSAIVTEVVTAYFGGIHAAQAVGSNLSESLNKIETFRNTGIPSIINFIDLIYGLIRNDESWDNDSEAEFATLQNKATSQIKTVVNSVFDGAEILAIAVHAKEANKDCFVAFQTAKATAVSALDGFTQSISAAGVIALIADNTG